MSRAMPDSRCAPSKKAFLFFGKVFFYKICAFYYTSLFDIVLKDYVKIISKNLNTIGMEKKKRAHALFSLRCSLWTI